VGFGSNKLLPRVLIQVLPATIAVLFAIGVYTTRIVSETMLETHQSRLERVAAQSTSAIALGLRNIADTADTLAANDLVINSLFDASERDYYIPTLFQSLRIPGPGQARVTLTDYRGRRIASNTPKITYANAPWIASVMEGHRLIDFTGNGMIIAVPVSYANSPEGVIVIEYDARGLADLLKLPVQADAYTIHTADDGIIYSSDAAFASVGHANPNPLMEGDWISVEAPVAGFPNLRLHVGDRLVTVLAPAARQESYLMLTIFLSLLAVTISIVVTAVKVIKPIKLFMAGVESVGASADLSYRMEPVGSDEFRRLTTSFNNMLSRLENMTISRDYVDSVLNSMNEFMVVVSPQGKIQSGNRAMAQILDCTADDLVDQDISKFISGGDWDELKELDTNGQSMVERTLMAAQNSAIPVLVSVSPLRQSDGIAFSLILVLSDITAQKTAEAMLEQHIKDLNRFNTDLERSNTDLEQFAYVASHDLKAPLRAIDNLAGWIEEDIGEQMPDDSREHMKLLRGRINRLEALLSGLLEYSRTGRDEIEPAWINSHALVQEVTELLSPPDSIQVNISQDMPHLFSAQTPLQQVFHNLIGNAIKHHDRENGIIEVTCRDLGSQFEFAVIDDGPGIPEKYHERVFQMFQTLKRRDEVEGSGIGLAVVEKLVRANGGSVTVALRGTGRGTEFRFTWEKHEPLMGGKHAA